MKIYINRDEVDFTLENENTLGQVFISLEKWLTSNGFSVSELFLDEQEISVTDRTEWQDKPLTGHDSMNIIALTLPELKLQNLNTLITYCRMIQKSLKEGNLSLLKELMDEYDYIENSYEVLLDDQSHSITDHMKNLLAVNGFRPAGERSEENVKSVLEGFIMLEAVIQGRAEEITDPARAGRDTYQAIQSLLPSMEEVSLMLQTGKDRDAMDVIIRFSELFQRLLRIFTYLPEKDRAVHSNDLKKYISEMSGILKELAEAFATEDSVLMGDLMEYEIMPRMENFPRFFESLINKGD